MQVCKYEEVFVHRDIDLVRDLLLHVDGDPQLDGRLLIRPDKPEDFGISGHSLEEVFYHLNMLIDEGFATGAVTRDGPLVSKLTWKGHELLDDIRDPDIWDKTKQRLHGLSSVGIALAWEIAKAEIKKRLGLN